MTKRKYVYDASVTEFGREVAHRWKGETWAVSPQKATSNLIYQFKKQTNRIASCKIALTGKVVEVA